MVYLYTRDYFWTERVKRVIKRLLGMREGGPQAVEDGLLRGLRGLGVPVSLNQPLNKPVEVLCVLTGGVRALHWAIVQKRRGLAKKILAGPILSVIPPDGGWLVRAPEVDLCVMPSAWAKNFWESFDPHLKDKLVLWPSGIADRGRLVKNDGQVLVFQKNAPAGLFGSVCKELASRGWAYEIMEYGKFRQNNYFGALSRSRFMVYLSQSESQGLALHEAWMAGVPTLVWNRGYATYKNYRWADEKISAPYLTPECGKFFKDDADFRTKLDSFLLNYQNFKPREYSLSHFTDELSARRYLDLINQLSQALI